MAKNLTQGIINKVGDDHPKRAQQHDPEVPGLRVVVGSKSSNYKFAGRINEGSKRYISVVIGRTSEVSLRSARDRAEELRLSLRRGIDPTSPKASVPSVGDALDRYLEGQGDELSPRTVTGIARRSAARCRAFARRQPTRWTARRFGRCTSASRGRAVPTARTVRCGCSS